MPVENYFDDGSAAERYGKGRPYHHPPVIRRIRGFLRLDGPLDRAVDIGCGTGMSAVALTEIARRVVAVDISWPMIALAPADRRIGYCLAAGEALPIRDSAADLVTLASAWHWMDRTRLFGQAGRILRPGGWLIAYNHSFSTRMEGNPAFHDWFQSSFLARYPPPARHWMEINDEEAERLGFRVGNEEHHPDTIVFSPQQLVGYLMTISNIAAAVEKGGMDAADIERRLADDVRPFFGHRKKATFHFGIIIWYFQKMEKPEDNSGFREGRQ